MTNALPFHLDDPHWLAHRHIESEELLRFVHVPRTERAQISFLTDACLGERSEMHTAPVTDTLQAFGPANLRWIFHSAFCGSTLLTHALDIEGLSSSLSEPVLLNDVVGLRRRGAKSRDVARLADAALRALGRSYPGEEAVVIKPSNVTNPLAELFLALQPDAPAIFLFAPLETFLISVARKGLPCRLWVRELLEGYLQENFVQLGFLPEDYFRQSDLQVAAVGWLAQHAFFARLADKLGSDRIRFLDADRMVAQPSAAIDAVTRHFRLELDPGTADAIAAGPVFNRYSKTGAAYSADTRGADYALAKSSYGEEIDMVVLWATRVAEAAGVTLTPPEMLLDQEV